MLKLLWRSPKALELSRRRSGIQSELRSQKLKVWPVARVARLFNISERLLWQWIAAGCLPRYRRPTKSHKKGITSSAIRSFVKHLGEHGIYVADRTRSRMRPAEEKCRQIASRLKPEERLTPEKFAARANVSLATVHRLLVARVISAHRPTPRRIRICHWSEKYTKKHLTAKKTKKHG